MKQTKVSVRGQTVIPQEIREQLGITPKTKLAWSVRDGVIIVVPIPEDPVRAMKGILKGRGSVQELLAERRADREKEEAEVEELLKRWRSTR